MPTPTVLLRAAASRATALPARFPTSPTHVWSSRRPPRGFTLLRLLAVIAMLGTLSALAAPILVPGQP